MKPNTTNKYYILVVIVLVVILIVYFNGCGRRQPAPFIPAAAAANASYKRAVVAEGAAAGEWKSLNMPCANIPKTERNSWSEYADVIQDDGTFQCQYLQCREKDAPVQASKCGFKKKTPLYSGCYRTNTNGKPLTMNEKDCNVTAWGVLPKTCSSIPDSDKRKWIEHADVIKEDAAKSRECWFRYVKTGAYDPKIDSNYIGCFRGSTSGPKCNDDSEEEKDNDNDYDDNDYDDDDDDDDDYDDDFDASDYI